MNKRFYTLTAAAAAMALLGAGCSWFSRMEATDAPSTSTGAVVTPSQNEPPTTPATSTPPAPTNPGAPQLDASKITWKQYTDTATGFHFNYPVTSASQVWNGKTQLDLSAFPVHPHVERRLELGFLKNAKNQLDCSASEGKEASMKTVNGITFCLTKEQDAGAGSAFGTYTYATVRNGSEVRLTFSERHPNDVRIIGGCEDGTSTKPECQPFDQFRDTEIFERIVDSFQWDVPALKFPFSFTEDKQGGTGPGYKAEVRYPRMNDIGDVATQNAFNAAVKSATDAEVDAFLNDAKAEAGQSAGPWTFDLQGAVKYQTPRFVSVLFEGSIYTGGAHPNQVYTAFLFDMKTKKSLAFKDILANPTTGLKTISQKAIANLRDQNLKQEFTTSQAITNGAGPKEENFKYFYFTDKGLTIVFPPYQIAPYAAGPHQVDLTYAELRTVLKGEFIQ